MGWTLACHGGACGPQGFGRGWGDSALLPPHQGRRSPATFPFLDPFSPAVWLFMLLAYLAWLRPVPGRQVRPTCCLGGRGRGGGQEPGSPGCLSWLSRLRLEPWVPCSRPPFSLSGPVSVFPPVSLASAPWSSPDSPLLVLLSPFLFSPTVSVCVCVSLFICVSLPLQLCLPFPSDPRCLSVSFFPPAVSLHRLSPCPVVQPAPVPAGAPTSWRTSTRWATASGSPWGGFMQQARRSCPGAVHALRQRSLVRRLSARPNRGGWDFGGDPPGFWAHSYSPRQPCDGTQGRLS